MPVPWQRRICRKDAAQGRVRGWTGQKQKQADREAQLFLNVLHIGVHHVDGLQKFMLHAGHFADLMLVFLEFLPQGLAVLIFSLEGEDLESQMRTRARVVEKKREREGRWEQEERGRERERE